MLAKRRGQVTKDLPKPGTPIFIVQAYLPVIESFGFESDLRYHTQVCPTFSSPPSCCHLCPMNHPLQQLDVQAAAEASPACVSAVSGSGARFFALQHDYILLDCMMH